MAAALYLYETRPTPLILTLSDELLLRVLSYLPPTKLLETSFVCRHFYHLSSDSQLWRAAYFLDFVLPRALRLRPVTQRSQHDGDFTMRNMASLAEKGWWKRKWGDGSCAATKGGQRGSGGGGEHMQMDWKGRYKLRHNWAQGKCALEQLDMRIPENGACSRSKRSLVKIADGIAVTTETTSGLRAWNLRTRRPIAQAILGIDSRTKATDDAEAPGHDHTTAEKEATRCLDLPRPRSLALDGRGVVGGCLDIAVGFEGGGFGMWRLNLGEGTLSTRYRDGFGARRASKHGNDQPRGDDGGDAGGSCGDDDRTSHDDIVALAYSDPYLLTAASASAISLYVFENRSPISNSDRTNADGKQAATNHDLGMSLDPPKLITRLKSHTSPSTIALSIRQTATSTIASVAYTFSTLGGWSIGIQDLHIQPGSATCSATVTSTRLAYTTPQPNPPSSHGCPSPATSASPTRTPTESPREGPITLCYNHPYVLAALPDNTLILHLCTSTTSALSLSRGIRLWGHTSGISDADVTDRGRAVSVSSRGDEVRVWELEGGGGAFRSSADDDRRSVAVKPRSAFMAVANTTVAGSGGDDRDLDTSPTVARDEPDWQDSRRNWVGFDEEMVIVLQEARDGHESLMVYDFT